MVYSCTELHEYTPRLFQYMPISSTLILLSHTVISLCVLFLLLLQTMYALIFLPMRVTYRNHLIFFWYNVATGLERSMQISSWAVDLENEGSAFGRNVDSNSPTYTASYAQEHAVISSH